MNGLHGVHLVGGELLDWHEDEASLPGGAVLTELVARAVPATGRILVAGPHRADLVDRLVARGVPVTCLLRSYDDACALGRKHADSGITVLCGGLEKLGAVGPFDAIVAAGGFGRLGTPDAAALTWHESLAALTALLTRNGTLLVGMENDLGLHRLTEAEPALAPGSAGSGSLAGVPGGLRELVGLLPGAAVFALFPSLDRPRLAVPRERVGDLPDALLAAAFAAAGRQVLTDPRPLATRARAHGIGADLAPGWIAVLRPAELPAFFGDPEPGPWSAVCPLLDTPSGWERGAPATTPHACGRLARDPALLRGHVPAGEPFEELLLRLCARPDVPALRQTLGEYRRWQETLEPSARLFASPENVLVHDGRFTVLDQSWSWAEPIPADLATALAVRRFAVTLWSGGHARPWPSSIGLSGLIRTLFAMAALDQALATTAVTLEAELTAARGHLSPLEHAGVLAALHAGEPPAPLGHREALRANRALMVELAAAHTRATWTDTALREKEAELRDLKATGSHAKNRPAQKNEVNVLRSELVSVRDSTSFRLGRLLTWPLRTARAALRPSTRR